jgi:putative transposase
MPEHVHLLISESGPGSPAKIVQVFKQRVSRSLREGMYGQSDQQTFSVAESSPEFRRFWQRRYYDFNVHTRAKMMEKLQYMHGNPVRAKLVEHPGDWPWSSWSDYYRGEGLLRMDHWELNSPGKEEREERPTLLNGKG